MDFLNPLRLHQALPDAVHCITLRDGRVLFKVVVSVFKFILVCPYQYLFTLQLYSQFSLKFISVTIGRNQSNLNHGKILETRNGHISFGHLKEIYICGEYISFRCSVTRWEKLKRKSVRQWAWIRPTWALFLSLKGRGICCEKYTWQVDMDWLFAPRFNAASIIYCPFRCPSVTAWDLAAAVLDYYALVGMS